jgi:sterol desaturase/sphingolipid hydroxylase (fatty acid hydroxylase superfamily)
MQLSKFDYYTDYVAYPIVIVAVSGLAAARNDGHEELLWLAAFACGFTLWTFAEYWIHRVVLHRMPYFSPMHGAHHAAPLGLIGTPTWISIPTLCAVVLLPAWGLLGFNLGSGLFAGMMSGYVWYGAIHHLIHHRPRLPGLGLLRNLRKFHLRHHYRPLAGNFGVTTPLWDHVFGTVIRGDNRAGH